MIGCKCAIYLKIDFVLNGLQFEEPMGKRIHISKQPKTIVWQSEQDWRPHLKAVRLLQNKQLIWKGSDCNQLSGQLTKQLVKYKYKYKHPPWAWYWSEIWIKGWKSEIGQRLVANHRSLEDLRGSGGWYRKIKSRAILDSIYWFLVLLLTDIYVWLLKSYLFLLTIYLNTWPCTWHY